MPYSTHTPEGHTVYCRAIVASVSGSVGPCDRRDVRAYATGHAGYVIPLCGSCARDPWYAARPVCADPEMHPGRPCRMPNVVRAIRAHTLPAKDYTGRL